LQYFCALLIFSTVRRAELKEVEGAMGVAFWGAIGVGPSSHPTNAEL
jgi:hypothetical protein